MLFYIDVLYRNVEQRALEDRARDLLTSDDLSVRESPPFTLKPEYIGLGTSEGDFKVFDGSSGPSEMLDEFDLCVSRHVKAFDEFVGWRLDQVLVPSLSVLAFTHGARINGRFLRDLSDKFSKSTGYSVDRAFWQGWYSPSKSADVDLSLNDAAKLCGMKIEDVRSDVGITGETPSDTLLTRLIVISRMFSKYQDLRNGVT